MSLVWRTYQGPFIPGLPTSGTFLSPIFTGNPDRPVSWQRVPRAWAGWPRHDRRRTDPDWNGRVLLLLHGTGMRTQEGFAGLTPQVWADLDRLYSGRILAFNHSTIRDGVDDNVRQLARALGRQHGDTPTVPLHLDLDVLAISRGGLVARYISEGWALHRGLLGPHELNVHRIVFVGTPNDGTPTSGRLRRHAARRQGYAENLHWAWLTEVRRLVVENERDRSLPTRSIDLEPYDPTQGISDPRCAPGSRDQFPGSAVLERLNRSHGVAFPSLSVPEVRYFAFASDFDFHMAPNPTVGRTELLRSDVIDGIFGDAHNDLVVPTASVVDPRTSQRFRDRNEHLFPVPAARRCVLGQASNVTHVGYLRCAEVQLRLLGWLEEG